MVNGEWRMVNGEWRMVNGDGSAVAKSSNLKSTNLKSKEELYYE